MESYLQSNQTNHPRDFLAGRIAAAPGFLLSIASDSILPINMGSTRLLQTQAYLSALSAEPSVPASVCLVPSLPMQFDIPAICDIFFTQTIESSPDITHRARIVSPNSAITIVPRHQLLAESFPPFPVCSGLGFHCEESIFVPTLLFHGRLHSSYIPRSRGGGGCGILEEIYFFFLF